ncbi:hypothetical protein Tco_0047453 [Tanacetum coccineum]
MDTEEISDRYVAPCFVNGLEAYNGEINLRTEENMISNEFAVKLCLEHEDLLLDDLDFGDILDIEGIEVPPFVCKMEKNSRNQRKQLEKYRLICSDIGPSLRYYLLEEERPVIETMAYNDKYKKILDRIYIDKMKLDGEIKKEDEEVIIEIKREPLIEKKDPGAFVIPIRLEAKINLNALADTGSDINVMPYRPMGLLKDVLCQVGVTTIIAKFLILDGRGFVYTFGSILNTIERITSTFDGICHQTFCAAKTSLDTTKSVSDGEEELWEHMTMKPDPHDPNALDNTRRWRNYGEAIDEMLTIKFFVAGTNEEIFTSEAWTNAFNIDEPIYSELCHEFYSTYEFDEVCVVDKLRTKKIIKFRLCGRAFSWTLLEFAKRLGLYNSEEIEEEGFDVYFQGGLRSDEHFNAQEYWLSISREENLSLSRSHASTIRNPVLRVLYKMITYGLCQRTTRYDKMQKNDLWLLSMFEARHQNGYANVAWLIARWMKRKGAGSQKESTICCGQFITKIAKRKNLLFEEGRLIPEAPEPGVPRVSIPRPPRASMQDLYAGVFEQMNGVYSVPLQGAYNPPGYDQQQYDQYYQQYPPQQ